MSAPEAPNPAPEPPEDLLELGHERSGALSRLVARLPGLRALAVAAACVGLAVAVVAALHPARRVDGVGHLALLTRSPTGQATPASRAPKPSYYDAPLRAVDALAHHRGALTGYVRQTSPVGGCALVAIGHSPQQSVERALRRIAPRFRVRDLAVVLDEFTGMCALQLRADNVSGAILVISVASPAGHRRTGAYDRVQTGFELSPRTATKYAAVTTRRGFTVLVGATGPGRALPTDRQLLDLAHNPALTW